MSVGMMPSRADALVVVTSMRRSPWSTLIATGSVENGEFVPHRVFNL